MSGESWQVKLTRVMLPGALPESPTPYEVEVLTWLGRTTDEPSATTNR